MDEWGHRSMCEAGGILRHEEGFQAQDSSLTPGCLRNLVLLCSGFHDVLFLLPATQAHLIPIAFSFLPTKIWIMGYHVKIICVLEHTWVYHMFSWVYKAYIVLASWVSAPWSSYQCLWLVAGNVNLIIKSGAFNTENMNIDQCLCSK